MRQCGRRLPLSPFIGVAHSEQSAELQREPGGYRWLSVEHDPTRYGEIGLKQCDFGMCRGELGLCEAMPLTPCVTGSVRRVELVLQVALLIVEQGAETVE